MTVPHQRHWTEADYLDYEASSDSKHEYANGTIIAMTSAGWTHNAICVNISTTLNIQLAEKNCRVASNDLRLKVVSKRSYRYPDVLVICGEPQFVDDRVDTISNPTVVIEVLSERTALIDRNEKLDEYLQIESVQEYVLISQAETKIERYLRQDSDNWLYSHVTGLNHRLDLPSISCKLAVADIYNKVTLGMDSQ